MTDTLVQFRSAELAGQLAPRVSALHASQGLTARRDLERYYTLLDAARPTFYEAQAHLLCDVLNGTIHDPIEMGMRLLWASFEDAEDAYYDKWSVEKAPFVERLRALSEVEALAVIDAVERFWAASSATVQDVGLAVEET